MLNLYHQFNILPIQRSSMNSIYTYKAIMPELQMYLKQLISKYLWNQLLLHDDRNNVLLNLNDTNSV